MADPVDGICGCVHFNVDAGSLHDHAYDDEEDHDDETLTATPDINDFGNSKVADATKDGGHDARDAEETVLIEGGCHIWADRSLDGLQQVVNEGDEPETVIPVVSMTRRPLVSAAR